LLVVVVVVEESQATAPFPYGTYYQGLAKFFPTGGAGACQYDISDFNQDALLVAAVPKVQYEGGVHCGECIRVYNSNGSSVIMTIVDDVANTGVGNISISYYGFTILGGIGYDPIWVNWTSVPCVVTGGVIIVSSSSDGYYITFQIKNIKVPVAHFEVKVKGYYKNTTFQSYNEWTINTGTGLQPPFNVRITSCTGEQITGTLSQLGTLITQCIPQQFSEENPTTGATTDYFLNNDACNASLYPVGLTTDGNTGLPMVTTGFSNVTQSSGAKSSYSFNNLAMLLFLVLIHLISLVVF